MSLDEPKLSTETRIADLQNLQRTRGLSQMESWELNALDQFPTNEAAQNLCIRESQAYQGVGVFTEEDKRRLKNFRAEKYRKADQETWVISSGKSGMGHALNDDITIQKLHIQAKLVGVQEDWDGDPKEILDKMVDALPETTELYSRSEVESIPDGIPSDIELYILSKLDKLPQFQEQSRKGGIFSVMGSILCIRDHVRTKRFIQGIREAISSLEKNPSEEITVIDAGCGAIPLMGIYAALSSPKAHVTCIEFNPNSVHIAQEIVKAFGLENQIDVIEGDATKYQPSTSVDLLISETMHSGLTKEPMVQILSHLQRFVKPNGITLPTKVKVFAAMINEFPSFRPPISGSHPPRRYVKINDSRCIYVEPKWRQVVDYTPGDNLTNIAFEFEPSDVDENVRILVTSEVVVGSQILRHYDSEITTYQIAEEPIPGSNKSFKKSFQVNSGQKIRVSYKPGQRLIGVVEII